MSSYVIKWSVPPPISSPKWSCWHIPASRLTGDSRYADIATRHAETTLANHFRPDHTCYHVVSYNADGTVERRQTFQGKADDSSWARGQGWALYGFTETYRNTGRRDFLDRAVEVADMIIARNNTTDLVPYWDCDAIDAPETLRSTTPTIIFWRLCAAIRRHGAENRILENGN